MIIMFSFKGYYTGTIIACIQEQPSSALIGRVFSFLPNSNASLYRNIFNVTIQLSSDNDFNNIITRDLLKFS